MKIQRGIKAFFFKDSLHSDLRSDSCRYLAVILKQNYFGSAHVCSRSSLLMHDSQLVGFDAAALHYLQTGNNVGEVDYKVGDFKKKKSE